MSKHLVVFLLFVAKICALRVLRERAYPCQGCTFATTAISPNGELLNLFAYSSFVPNNQLLQFSTFNFALQQNNTGISGSFWQSTVDPSGFIYDFDKFRTISLSCGWEVRFSSDADIFPPISFA
jgi:hypothetical protein